MCKRLIMVGIAALFACGCLTEGNYSKKTAATYCKRLKECQPDQFDAEFSSVGDCKDRSAEIVGDLDYSDCLGDAGCKFDGAAARNCRSAMKSASCDELLTGGWASECAEVYNCDDADSMAIAACFTQP